MDVQAIGGLRFGTLTAIGGGGRAGQQFAVAQDQQLEGTVVSIDHDSVVVQVGGQRLAATTDAAVRPGDVLQLVVRETGADQVLMQIVGRGGTPAVQTRKLTGQELANELTKVGVQPDEESVAIADELLARGQPLTAENVLDVHGAVTRAVRTLPPEAEALPVQVGQGAPGGAAQSEAAGVDVADVRAAVFLKSQGLPVTPAAIQIVRQAWASSSALGEHVEQLRDALADLATRLTEAGAGADGATEPGTARSGATPPPGTPGTPSPSPSPRGRGDVGAAPVVQGGTPAARAPGTASGRPVVVLTGEEPSPETTSSLPPAGAAPTRPAGQGTMPPQAFPLPLGEGQGEGVPGTATPAPAPRAGATPAPDPAPPSPQPAPDASLPDAPASPPPAQSAPPAASAFAPSARPASLADLLDAVARTLDQVKVVDDQAVAGPRPELARQIRQVVADQGTPVEAKLARVLEGLASGPTLDHQAVADLRTTLTRLVDAARQHLEQPQLAARLPHEALRDLLAVREHAGAILGQVELQQMTNAHAATAPGPDSSYLMFQVPIPGGRDGQTAQVRIRQDEEGGSTKRIDPKNAHVVLQFELQNLGTVRVGLRLQGQRISCRMGSSDPAATALLGQHAQELRDGLGGLGYFVDDLRCATLTPDELRAPDPEAPETPSRPTMRLDARA